jgi:hypothetical protein
MQAHRHLKLAVICTVALALPASAATAAIVASDAPPAPKAKIYRHSCPINNPDYVGPKPRRL